MKKTTYILHPLNENQEMNCFVQLDNVTLRDAMQEASKIASKMTDIFGRNASITCRLMAWEEHAKDEPDYFIIAHDGGKFTNQDGKAVQS